MGPLTTFSIESRCVCSCQSLLDILADVFHNAQHPTCNEAPLLDALFALVPVPNDLSPKGHTRIIGCLFHLGGGVFVTADIILAFLLRWGGLFKHTTSSSSLSSSPSPKTRLPSLLKLTLLFSEPNRFLSKKKSSDSIATDVLWDKK